MQKVIDYSILIEYDKVDLEESVRRGLKNGWQPKGGISSYVRKDPTRGIILVFAQAMVKCEE